MPRTIEVDEEDYRAKAQLQGVISKALQNPQARKLLEQAHKMVDPNAITPALDAENTIKGPVDEVTKMIAEFRKEQEEARVKSETDGKVSALNANIDKGLSRLRADGWTDEGIESVKKIMDEKGILDPEVAAAYHEKLHPPQTVSTPGGTGAWNFMSDVSAPNGDADIKQLIASRGDSNSLVDKMARDALNEVRGANRR